MFENYKDSLFNNNTILRSQLRFKSDLHNVYTEEINKIVLNSNDDKWLQTRDRITTYPYGTNADKVCEKWNDGNEKIPQPLENLFLHVNKMYNLATMNQDKGIVMPLVFEVY